MRESQVAKDAFEAIAAHPGMTEIGRYRILGLGCWIPHVATRHIQHVRYEEQYSKELEEFLMIDRFVVPPRVRIAGNLVVGKLDDGRQEVCGEHSVKIKFQAS